MFQQIIDLLIRLGNALTAIANSLFTVQQATEIRDKLALLVVQAEAIVSQPPPITAVLAALSLPSSVLGLSTFAGIVSLTSPVSVDTVISFTVSNGVLQVPATVTIPANQNQANVLITAGNPPSNIDVIVTATLGSQSKSSSVTVQNNP